MKINHLNTNIFEQKIKINADNSDTKQKQSGYRGILEFGERKQSLYKIVFLPGIGITDNALLLN